MRRNEYSLIQVSALESLRRRVRIGWDTKISLFILDVYSSLIAGYRQRRNSAAAVIFRRARISDGNFFSQMTELDCLRLQEMIFFLSRPRYLFIEARPVVFPLPTFM